MPLIIHLIPYDGIGGVERAAASMGAFSTGDIEFRVQTIFPKAAATNRWVLWNPWFFFCTVKRLWQSQADVLIVSLWRAYALGSVIKLLRPKLRLVVFLHLSHDVHLLDRILTRLATRLACRVWTDSYETLSRRLPSLATGKGCVISFVTDRIDPLPSETVRPTFIFWGRLHPQKAISRALKIFADIRAMWPTARFWIIGPDGGELSRLQKEALALDLGDSVQFLGPRNFVDIKDLASKASFYLQTSEQEGMAMSVVEAMQFGLVPVVTPVGEIANYARNGDNAVVVVDDASAVTDVLALLDNDWLYQRIHKRAIVSWENQPLYRDSVLAACFEVLRTNETEYEK